MRTAFAILCSCVLLTFSVVIESAQAGDYYDGYRARRSANVWYSSDCCYKKIVRHVRQVRYVRTDPYRRHGYYDGPRYRDSYYGPPRYYDYRYRRPAHYSTVYVEPARPRYTDYYSPRYTSYRGYDAYNSAQCYSRRVPVLDGRGGWVWGFRRVCN